MIPELEKYYSIACLGPYEYNVWKGVGRFNGDVDTSDPDQVLYGFDIPVEDQYCAWFAEEDIIAETVKP